MNRKIAGFRVAQEGDPQCEYHSLCRSGHIATPAYTTRLFLCQSAYMAYILRGIHQLHAGKRNGGGGKGGYGCAKSDTAPTLRVSGQKPVFHRSALLHD